MLGAGSVSCHDFASGSAGHNFLAATNFFLTLQCLLDESWPTQATVKDGDTFDFIIVGAGTTGSVMAGRLSEVRNWNILVIEAGPNPPLESIVPYYWERISAQNTMYSWNYTTRGNGKYSKGFLNESYGLPRGKLLGGCSSINGMYYVRGDEHDFQSWYNAGNLDWSWDTVLKYYKKAESLNDKTLDLRSRTFHGKAGPLKIARYNYTNQNLVNELINSFGELGYQTHSDINGPSRLGVSRLHGYVNDGKRVSSSTAYLNPSRNRKNLHVLKSAFVEKVLVDDSRRATGVRVRLENGKIVYFNTKLEVIVSAGTINSPQLLMLSGIGPKQHLESLGIKSVQNLPVGDNYRDHLFIPFPIVMDKSFPTLSEKEYYFEAMKYLFNQTGLFASIYSPDVVAMGSVTSGVKYPQFEHTIVPYPQGSAELVRFVHSSLNYNKSVKESLISMIKKKDLLEILIIMLHPKSSGYVKLASKSPSSKPIIYPNFYSDIRDINLMVEGVKSLSKILNTKYFKSKNAAIERLNLKECNALKFPSDAYWSCISVHLSSSYYHPVGTCKMGSRPSGGVVDSKLRVYGVSGLRLADASVMPSHVSGNPQATCIMIGENLADMIKKLYSKK